MCHVYRLLYYLVCVFDVYDQSSFSFSPVFPQSVQWRLGYWNLSAPLRGTAYGAIMRTRPPAAAPAGGGVA